MGKPNFSLCSWYSEGWALVFRENDGGERSSLHPCGLIFPWCRDQLQVVGEAASVAGAKVNLNLIWILLNPQSWILFLAYFDCHTDELPGLVGFYIDFYIYWNNIMIKVIC